MAKTYPLISAMAEFLCFLALVQGGSLLRFYPSEVALSSLILAAHMLEEEQLLTSEFLSQTLQSMSDALHEHEASLTKEDLKKRINACLADLHEAHRASLTMPQKAVRTKYSHSKYFGIANTECMDQAPQLE